MASDGEPRGRAGRRCGALTRVDVLVFLLAAALCSASYCLGIWHNSRGVADSSVLGPSAAAASCGGDADEPLDFEARHAAEGAGLSVSSVAAETTSARRGLRGAAEAGGGERLAAQVVGSRRLRFTDAGAVGA